MNKILFIVLLTNILYADAFTLNDSDKEFINNSFYKKKIIKRLDNFDKFFEKAQTYNEIKKLNRVNNYVNRIIPKNEPTNEWSTPKEFLINGNGDCEDYAITKYFALKKLNLNTKRLLLAVVKVKGSKNFHMVLMYINKKNKAMILDNLSWKMLPLEKRKNLTFKYAFNERASYVFENSKLVVERGVRRAEVKMFRDMIRKTR